MRIWQIGGKGERTEMFWKSKKQKQIDKLAEIDLIISAHLDQLMPTIAKRFEYYDQKLVFYVIALTIYYSRKYIKYLSIW